MSGETTLKCVAVGDGATGKSCLFQTFANGTCPDDYLPTIFDQLSTTTSYQGKKDVTLDLFDTAGQDDYDELRPVSYIGTDVFFIIFSLVDPMSFNNVKNRWIPELKEFIETKNENVDVPFILVGTKLDLREDPSTLRNLKENGENPIVHEQGRKLSAEIGAFSYVECSSVTKENLALVFEEGLNAGLGKPKKGGKGNIGSHVTRKRKDSKKVKGIFNVGLQKFRFGIKKKKKKKTEEELEEERKKQENMEAIRREEDELNRIEEMRIAKEKENEILREKLKELSMIQFEAEKKKIETLKNQREDEISGFEKNWKTKKSEYFKKNEAERLEMEREYMDNIRRRNVEDTEGWDVVLQEAKKKMLGNWAEMRMNQENELLETLRKQIRLDEDQFNDNFSQGKKEYFKNEEQRRISKEKDRLETLIRILEENERVCDQHYRNKAYSIAERRRTDTEKRRIEAAMMNYKISETEYEEGIWKPMKSEYFSRETIRRSEEEEEKKEQLQQQQQQQVIFLENRKRSDEERVRIEEERIYLIREYHNSEMKKQRHQKHQKEDIPNLSNPHMTPSPNSKRRIKKEKKKMLLLDIRRQEEREIELQIEKEISQQRRRRRRRKTNVKKIPMPKTVFIDEDDISQTQEDLESSICKKKLKETKKYRNVKSRLFQDTFSRKVQKKKQEQRLKQRKKAKEKEIKKRKKFRRNKSGYKKRKSKVYGSVKSKFWEDYQRRVEEGKVKKIMREKVRDRKAKMETEKNELIERMKKNVTDIFTKKTVRARKASPAKFREAMKKTIESGRVRGQELRKKRWVEGIQKGIFRETEKKREEKKRKKKKKYKSKIIPSRFLDYEKKQTKRRSLSPKEATSRNLELEKRKRLEFYEKYKLVEKKKRIKKNRRLVNNFLKKKMKSREGQTSWRDLKPISRFV